MKNKKRNLKENIKLYLSGVLMGASDIIPGVSGGTMAFILGIYEELIDSIRSINKSLIIKVIKFQLNDVLKIFPWKFLLILGLGIITAIITLSHGLEWILTEYPSHTWGFFFGLVLASVFTVLKSVNKWSYSKVTLMLTGSLIAYSIVGITPTTTPDTPIYLIGAGAIAITAMILPGISGSFILLILGKYQTVLEAVNDRDLLTLGYLILGAVIGILSIAQLLGYLFKKYHDATIAVLAGVMLGSLRKLWPFKETVETTINKHGEVIPLIERAILPQTLTNYELTVMLTTILGLGFIMIINKIAEKKIT